MIKELSTQHKTWTPAKLQTRNLTLRQAAQKAHLNFTMGFSACYLDGKRTEFRDAREIIGQKLLAQ